MYYLGCHHWSKISNKIDNILGSSGHKTTQIPLKMTAVSAGTETFENLKLITTDPISMKLPSVCTNLTPFLYGKLKS